MRTTAETQVYLPVHIRRKNTQNNPIKLILSAIMVRESNFLFVCFKLVYVKIHYVVECNDV